MSWGFDALWDEDPRNEEEYNNYFNEEAYRRDLDESYWADRSQSVPGYEYEALPLMDRMTRVNIDNWYIKKFGRGF